MDTSLIYYISYNPSILIISIVSDGKMKKVLTHLYQIIP